MNCSNIISIAAVLLGSDSKEKMKQLGFQTVIKNNYPSLQEMVSCTICGDLEMLGKGKTGTDTRFQMAIGWWDEYIRTILL